MDVQCRNRAFKGFTLIELLITISIVAILLGVGLPSFVNFIDNNLVTAQANDPCAGEGTSWLMEVDAFNGGRLDESVFDFNKDRIFNNADMINVGDIDGDGEDNYVHGSGIQRKNAGILSRPGIINHPDGRTESKYVTTSKGKVESILEDSGRNRHTPWREIR